MNWFVRSTAVVAGTLLGAGVLSAPANAATGELTAEASCTDTGWQVRWTLTPDDADGVLSNVSGVRYARLTTFVDNATVTAGSVLTEVQPVPPWERSASLSFTVTRPDGTRNLRMSAQPPDACMPGDDLILPSGSPIPLPIPIEESSAPTIAPTTAAPTTAVPGAGGGGLPVTGAAAGSLAAGAALLLGAGALLFAVARRRRVRFTP